jgi:hypothetical protein
MKLNKTHVQMTEWFPADTKPVRVGVYLVDWPSQVGSKLKWYSFFDGEKWGWMDFSVNKAIQGYSQDKVRHTGLCWRGLSSKP